MDKFEFDYRNCEQVSEKWFEHIKLTLILHLLSLAIQE